MSQDNTRHKIRGLLKDWVIFATIFIWLIIERDYERHPFALCLMKLVTAWWFYIIYIIIGNKAESEWTKDWDSQLPGHPSSRQSSVYLAKQWCYVVWSHSPICHEPLLVQCLIKTTIRKKLRMFRRKSAIIVPKLKGQETTQKHTHALSAINSLGHEQV